MRHLLIAAGLCLVGLTATAETYRLKLGSDQIGTFTYTPESLTSTITDSPLGVGNGQFMATSRAVQLENGDVVTQFLSDAPAKGRKISVLHRGGVVRETTVSPAADATDLSVAAAVPTGVVDPIAALGHLLADRSSCPGTIKFYEGRRVITVAPAGSTQTDDMLSCDMTYRVTAGPGHFSPLYIKRAQIALTYQAGHWQSLAASTGPFSLTVTR